jgi:hypothetical protein
MCPVKLGFEQCPPPSCPLTGGRLATVDMSANDDGKMGLAVGRRHLEKSAMEKQHAWISTLPLPHSARTYNVPNCTQNCNAYAAISLCGSRKDGVGGGNHARSHQLVLQAT